jgi:hypothetical protein
MGAHAAIDTTPHRGDLEHDPEKCEAVFLQDHAQIRAGKTAHIAAHPRNRLAIKCDDDKDAIAST